jgi:hypothetical protein
MYKSAAQPEPADTVELLARTVAARADRAETQAPELSQTRRRSWPRMAAVDEVGTVARGVVDMVASREGQGAISRTTAQVSSREAENHRRATKAVDHQAD